MNSFAFHKFFLVSGIILWKVVEYVSSRRSYESNSVAFPSWKIYWQLTYDTIIYYHATYSTIFINSVSAPSALYITTRHCSNYLNFFAISLREYNE